MGTRKNTRKAYYDSCSEFYKLVGPDSLNQKLIKKLLKNQFSAEDHDLIHSESKRPLSTIQLLELIEEKISFNGLLSNQIRLLGKERMEADHKITPATAEESNFVEKFISVCQDFSSAAKQFQYKLRQHAFT